MRHTPTTTGRAALALAAARGMRERELAAALNMHPSTLSRKIAGRQAWTDTDSLAVADALGDGVDALIMDLERVRATRQYHAAAMPGQTAIGQAS